VRLPSTNQLAVRLTPSDVPCSGQAARRSTCFTDGRTCRWRMSAPSTACCRVRAAPRLRTAIACHRRHRSTGDDDVVASKTLRTFEHLNAADESRWSECPKRCCRAQPSAHVLSSFPLPSGVPNAQPTIRGLKCCTLTRSRRGAVAERGGGAGAPPALGVLPPGLQRPGDRGAVRRPHRRPRTRRPLRPR